MHFAAGMCGASVIGGAVSLIWRRGYRFLPLAMTAGGLWAMIPDLPRLFREDFPTMPLAKTLGSSHLERQLHAMGDLFFFHARLDSQPHEYALLGLFTTIVLYNISIILMLILEYRQRNSIANRSWRAHQAILKKLKRNESLDTVHINEVMPEELPDDSVIARIHCDDRSGPGASQDQFPRISS